MIDKELQRKLDRLCEAYAAAQAKIELQRPVKLPRLRQQRRAERAVAETVGELGKARKARCLPLVRLAYVRALREVSPEATLHKDQEREVRYLTRRLRKELSQAEVETVREFSRHMRLLMAAQSMRVAGGSEAVARSIESGARPVALEQRARASVGSVVTLAQVAGNLASTSSGSYDGRV